MFKVQLIRKYNEWTITYSVHSWVNSNVIVSLAIFIQDEKKPVKDQESQVSYSVNFDCPLLTHTTVKQWLSKALLTNWNQVSWFQSTSLLWLMNSKEEGCSHSFTEWVHFTESKCDCRIFVCLFLSRM